MDSAAHLIAPGGAASVGCDGGSGTFEMLPDKWHFKHDEKWNAPDPFMPLPAHSGFGLGFEGSLPSWHATHEAIGGMLILRSDVAVFMFMWHVWHAIDEPMRGSSLCVLWLNEWIFDGGLPAFFAVLWHSPHLFIVGCATLPPCPAPE